MNNNTFNELVIDIANNLYIKDISKIDIIRINNIFKEWIVTELSVHVVDYSQLLSVRDYIVSLFYLFSDYTRKDQFLYYLKLTIKDVLCTKAKEYATNDRLHNFTVASNITGLSKELCCIIFAMKHWVSIQDIITDTIPMNQDTINEKFIDMINYTILLEAIIRDEEI